ncbi:MAG: hypothetical protein MI810_07065 [Flavobacteriales bacterium]|nr:hypothetical protein [Flavobacteriales bacterium]
MKRSEVLDEYIKNKIEAFSEGEREEELHEVWFTNWSEVDGWENLSQEIKNSIKTGSLPKDYLAQKYDEVLYFKFRDQFKGYRNEYLVKQTALQITSGEAVKLDACPCCGLRSIEARYAFEICTVCWWEDDGEDNDRLNGMGANEVSLTEGRLNFIQHGIYNPERDDLRELQDEPEKFEKERVFEIQKGFLVELGTEWKIKIDEHQNE